MGGACFSKGQGGPSSKQPVMATTRITQSGGIETKYKLIKMLGTGNFGKVALGQNRSDKEHLVAIKSISKSKIKQSMELIKEEIKIL